MKKKLLITTTKKKKIREKSHTCIKTRGVGLIDIYTCGGIDAMERETICGQFFFLFFLSPRELMPLEAREREAPAAHDEARAECGIED